VQVCFIIAGYRGKIKVKKVLRGIGLLAVSRFLALRVKGAFHFFPLPLSDILPRANHATRHPQTPPATHASPPATRRHGNRCRFAWFNVPVGLKASNHA